MLPKILNHKAVMRNLFALSLLAIPFTLCAYLLGSYGDEVLRFFIKLALDAAARWV